MLKCKYFITFCFSFSGIINTLLKHHAAHVNIPNTRSLSHTMLCFSVLFRFVSIRFVLFLFFWLSDARSHNSPHTTEACWVLVLAHCTCIVCCTCSHRFALFDFDEQRKWIEWKMLYVCTETTWNGTNRAMYTRLMAYRCLPNSMAIFFLAKCWMWMSTKTTSQWHLHLYMWDDHFFASRRTCIWWIIQYFIWWSIGTGVCSSDYEMCSSISWLV